MVTTNFRERILKAAGIESTDGKPITTAESSAPVVPDATADDSSSVNSDSSEDDVFDYGGNSPPMSDDIVDFSATDDAIADLDSFLDTLTDNPANNAKNFQFKAFEPSVPAEVPVQNQNPKPAPIPAPETDFNDDLMDVTENWSGGINDYYMSQLDEFKQKSEPPVLPDEQYDRNTALTLTSWLRGVVETNPNNLEKFMGLVDEYKNYFKRAVDSLTVYKTKIPKAKTTKNVESCRKEMTKYTNVKQTFSSQNTTLQNMLDSYQAIPQYIAKLKAMLPTCTDEDARTAMITYIDGKLITYNGAVDMLRVAHTHYLELLSSWRSYDNMLSECENQISIVEQRINAERVVQQEISEVAQENAKTAFDQYGEGSSMGVFVSVKELERILNSALVEYTGGNYSAIQEFGITDAGDIIINDKLFSIANHIDLTSENAMKIPQIYREQITAGKWGCIFNFRFLTRCQNLRILDLSQAPNRKMDVICELGINRGNWATLFRRRSKFPMLQEIRLPDPEGTITRENRGRVFNSNSEYQKFTNETQTVEQHNQQALASMGQDVKDSVSKGFETFKSVVWSKPLPRTLIKTFGYAVGVPAYWGIMTALGPVGVVMGALGIGAMAHHEYKQFKSAGS